jgi:hypothetical protein
VMAANTGEGYVWPYWDDQVGDVVGEVDGRTVCKGEIAFRKLSPEQVLWEPGYDFGEAPVHIVKMAHAPSKVMAREGYIGPDELTADSTGMDYELGKTGEKTDLVTVYEWLERPSPAHREGRWLSFLANGQLVQHPRPYPRDSKFNDHHAPAIHQLVWTRRDHRHRGMGIMERALDIQRTYNRTISQIIAWKNLVLNPQLLAPWGSMVGEATDEPGAIRYYRPVGGHAPQWQQVPDIPQSLFQVLQNCIDDLEELFGKREPPDTESAQHLQTVIEREQTRRGLVVKELARWYSGLGRHLLELVRKHYSENRLLRVQGRFGVDLIPDFKGTEAFPDGIPLVRVSPASIEPRTRAAQEAKIMTFLERGWVPIHQAMAALNGGTADKLIDDFELDIDKQYREIQRMVVIQKEDADKLPKLEDERDRIIGEAEMMGQPISETQAAELAMEGFVAAVGEIGPQVEEGDNHVVHIDVLSQWMKTRDFEDQSEVVQGLARAHRSQHQQLADLEAQKQAMMQSQEAQDMGQQNASRPGESKGQPSQPSQKTQKEGLQ